MISFFAAFPPAHPPALTALACAAANAAAGSGHASDRCRAKSQQLERFETLLPESQGQYLALTILFLPSSLDIGIRDAGRCGHGSRTRVKNRSGRHMVYEMVWISRRVERGGWCGGTSLRVEHAHTRALSHSLSLHVSLALSLSVYLSLSRGVPVSSFSRLSMAIFFIFGTSTMYLGERWGCSALGCRLEGVVGFRV